MNIEVNGLFGHEIRKSGQCALFKLHTSGRYGLLSFVKSCIQDGETCPFFIENLAVDIGGESMRSKVAEAVREGLGRYWVEDQDGTLLLASPPTPVDIQEESVPAGSQFGFSVLQEAQKLKVRFDRAGSKGHVSFAKACIASGITKPDEIIAEACAVAGDHMEGPMETLLDEGENIHWRKCADGSLQLID